VFLFLSSRIYSQACAFIERNPGGGKKRGYRLLLPPIQEGLRPVLEVNGVFVRETSRKEGGRKPFGIRSEEGDQGARGGRRGYVHFLPKCRKHTTTFAVREVWCEDG
jgi:hypothetical protein